MSESRRTEKKTAEPPSTGAKPVSAGRVVHDSRGNAVWDWAIDTDVMSSSGLLRALTPAEQQLALEGDASPAVGWAGDPYNRSR